MLANMSGIGGIDNLFVISGGANGADSIARLASLELGCGFKEVKANWSKYGKSAGHIRNSEMLDMNPDIVWAFPLGASPGTRNCIMQAKQRGIRVDEYHNYFEV